MTADWAKLPYVVLTKVSLRIVTEVPGINRVVYDITSKLPGAIEWGGVKEDPAVCIAERPAGFTVSNIITSVNY